MEGRLHLAPVHHDRCVECRKPCFCDCPKGWRSAVQQRACVQAACGCRYAGVARVTKISTADRYWHPRLCGAPRLPTGRHWPRSPSHTRRRIAGRLGAIRTTSCSRYRRALGSGMNAPALRQGSQDCRAVFRGSNTRPRAMSTPYRRALGGATRRRPWSWPIGRIASHAA